ncbi:hypothetical protein B0H11DRAFT_2261133 [Mycena galericulata]|nr:hypothetical protein B0H11DRAFT_2261133 [Mycena galericulata]
MLHAIRVPVVRNSIRLLPRRHHRCSHAAGYVATTGLTSLTTCLCHTPLLDFRSLLIEFGRQRSSTFRRACFKVLAAPPTDTSDLRHGVDYWDSGVELADHGLSFRLGCFFSENLASCVRDRVEFPGRGTILHRQLHMPPRVKTVMRAVRANARLPRLRSRLLHIPARRAREGDVEHPQCVISVQPPSDVRPTPGHHPPPSGTSGTAGAPVIDRSLQTSVYHRVFTQ